MQVSPTPCNYKYCRISSKFHDCGGRLTVKKLKIAFRAKNSSTNVLENLSEHRKTRDRSFCFSTVSVTFMVHCMETRSIQSGNGCNAANLVHHYLYAFPTLSMLNKILRKIAQDQVKRMLIVALTWLSQVWYPILLRMSIEKPLILSHHHIFY